MKNNKHLTIATAIALLLSMATSALAANVRHAKEWTKQVKVAMTTSGIFVTLDAKKEPVSGYAYEYLEALAAYSGTGRI